MKAICIKQKDWERVSGPDIFTPDPVFGEIVTIIDTVQRASEWYHQLQGYIPKYRVEEFAPLSSIDETEFERNYNLVTLPSNY